MTLQAILFDKDGTLFGFQASWARAFERYLTTLPDALRDPVAQAMEFDRAGGVFGEGSLAIAATSREMAEALQPILGGTVASVLAALDAMAADAEMAPVCDLRAALGRLRALCPLGVVTNDSEAPARHHLEAAGISDLFDFVAGFDSGHGAKPAPGPIRAGVKALGATPETALMVGDSLHDLMAGRAAGLGTVGVLTGVAGADELGPHADVILPDISHLPAWLAGRGQASSESRASAV
ncbi:MAG: HAD family hydrolase [Silicimonas sp.]|nr:HAD family hydrolase [Silicimonas sp.]